jgi:hypothetical protein
VIEGGWVCRSCWNSNRPTDARCYRCHTPRVDELYANAGPVSERVAVAPAMSIRLDTDLPFLTLLATLPIRVYGTLSVAVGVLIVMLGLLGGGVSVVGLAPVSAGIILIIPIGIVTGLFGFWLIFLANRVGRHARWAYVVAFLLFLTDSVPRLLGVLKPVFTNDVINVVLLISAWVSFGTAVCAGALLLTSFVRQSAE